MTIAIPEFNGRVSPVFDTCQHLLVFDIRPDGKREETKVDWSKVVRPYRAFQLRNNKVDTLICGGISNWLAGQINAQEIQLVPWVSGGVYDVLNAFLAGRLFENGFFMPGCNGRGRQGTGRGRRGFRDGPGRSRGCRNS